MKLTVKIASLLLAVLMLACMAACGGNSEPDPNEGLYEGTSAEMWGLSLNINDVYDGGFSVELMGNGKCRISVGDEAARGKWELDGTAFSCSGGGVDLEGTLQDGVMILENVMDSGVRMTLINKDYTAPVAQSTAPAPEAPAAAPAPAVTAPEATAPETTAPETPSTPVISYEGDGDMYVITEYIANGQSYSGKDLEMVGMENTFLLLNADHTGQVSFTGEGMDMQWTDKGEIQVAGMTLYTFTFENSNTVKLNMYDTIYFMLEKAN